MPRHFKLLKKSSFPLPPLAEQHRIVAKVNELMAICDKLEETFRKRQETRQHLTLSGLSRLSKPNPDEKVFREDVGFLLKNFAQITEYPEQMGEIRKTILNLAVRGRLVPQDPNDEPASELLKKIAEEKKKMIGEGKMKKEKVLPPIDEEEKPFEVPEGWEWVRLGKVAHSKAGKTLHSNKNKGTFKRYLCTANVKWFLINVSNLKTMRFEEHELKQYQLQRGDVLILEGGEAGRTAVWSNNNTDIYYQNHIHRVRFFGKISPYFFPLTIYTDFHNGRLSSYCAGLTIKCLSAGRLAKYTFPLPPLAEQHRIVAKVNELMAVCDKLETSLINQGQTRSKLLDSLLAEALGVV